MEDDRRFRLGRLGDESFQWPDRIYQARQQEKRPCLQTNRMPAFVALALNDVIGANLRPSVQPVDDKADVKTAEVLSALIRNTEHISQVEAVYAAAIDSMAENGRGYVQINMNILKSLKRSPLGLDLYLWLTYRTFALKRQLRLSWPLIYRQFGADPARAGDTNTVNNFRTKCLRELKKIKDAWPDLHYRTVKGALVLSPSPPRIPPSQLRLVE